MESSDDCLLVGSENRKYAWILSRKPKLSDEVRKDLVRRLDLNGFNIEKIHYTVQSNV